MSLIQKGINDINNIIFEIFYNNVSKIYSCSKINLKKSLKSIKKRIQMHKSLLEIKSKASKSKIKKNNCSIIESNYSKKETFLSPESHININEKNVSYFVPDICLKPIEIRKKHLKKVEQILFLNSFVPQNYSTIDNCWIEAKGSTFTSKMVPVNVSRNKEVTKDSFSNKLANKIKARNDSELSLAHLSSFEILYNKLLNSKETELEINSDDDFETDSVLDFCWTDEKKMCDQINNHFKSIKVATKIKSSALLKLPNFAKNEKIAYCAEMIYGSWCSLFDADLNSEEDISFAINYAIRRAKTIRYILEKPILSLKDSREYCDKILSFVVNEMSRPLINLKGQSVVGWQRKYRYCAEDIYEFPVQCILSLNSTSGRLMICYNWEHLVDHPYFIKQRIYDHVFGFTIDDDMKLSNICTNHNEKLPRGIIEIKLNLISHIERKIRNQVAKLKPVLSWRLLVEKHLQKIKNENYLIEENINSKEEDAYSILICNMYYLSLLKHESFNPEKRLRLKLNCHRCESGKANKLNPHCCCCCYGINKKLL